MSEPNIRRHGLEPLLREMTGAGNGDAALRVSIRKDLGHINLRGDPSDKAFVAAVEGVIGQPLPVAPNTFSTDPHRVFWLGPDEWLIVATAERVTDLVAGLSDATSRYHAAVNDISGGQVALLAEGGETRDLLAKGCTLDLHASVFSAGCCAQSGLAKANVLLACVDDTPAFMIVVRRSFSDYLCRWLLKSGQSYGITISDV